MRGLLERVVDYTVGLLSEKPPDSFKYTVLLRIVWMVLAWDLKHRRESVCVSIKSMSYLLGDLYVLSDNEHTLW